MVTDILENFYIFLAKNPFLKIQNLNSQFSKLVQLSHYLGWKGGPYGLSFVYVLYGVLFLICSKITIEVLESYQTKILNFNVNFLITI